MEIIKIEKLTKSYDADFSLEDINLTLLKGKIFALLGPNGAGKTTLVKLILNLMHADAGTVKINGLDASDKNSRKGIAFVPEKFNFFPFYTAKGVLEFFGKMKGIENDKLNEEVINALTKLQILELANKKLGKMSKGQMQRVGLASILLGKNDLIILDEPFSGLDPVGIRDLKEIIRNLKKDGKTLFINSHILLEMEHLADDVAILNKGKMLFTGTVTSILQKEKSLDDFFYKAINGEKN